VKYTIALGIAAVLVLSACHKPAEDMIQTKHYEVERLFDIDGCNVYRFFDSGYKYVVTCPNGMARTNWDETRTTGKTTTTEEHEVNTGWSSPKSKN
jgi:hypothetical protein